ncbi:site-specific DNA-methyltransferase [Azospirillum sp. SYSU D00513]|uniref:site-specific DNA-methyltransferase n=1 Tax=Azospirillum sp. SYSU D00513 TaxID=2812561 RepID=UPI001A96FBFC|nr:site-specific DNA-methyltransferase [Azospirillum sp. SYSU D00513]
MSSDSPNPEPITATATDTAGNDYDSMPKELLVRLLRRRDSDPGRRLGLVWERNELDHEDSLVGLLPTMTVDPSLCLGAAPYDDLIIEGDNFEALKLLAMTHAGRVRCIYIDPPYNTGTRDFVYKDRYIDPNHRFRQSTWLEFLYRRLLLARRLLSDDGVILVSINDDNRARLELLMDQVFDGMRVGSLVWRSRIGGNEGGRAFLSVDHEHVLVYAGPNFRFGGREKSFAMYSNPDDDERGDWRRDNLVTNVKYTDKRAGNAFYPLHDPVTDTWYPCNPNAVWRYASRSRLRPGQRLKTKTMEEFVAEGKVLFPKGERVAVWETRDALLAAIDAGDVPHAGGMPLLRRDLPDLDFWIGRKVGWGTPAFKRHKRDLRHATQPLSSWIRAAAERSAATDAERTELTSAFTDEGGKTLQRLFGDKVFNYPKPPSLLTELIRQSTEPGDLVVDFFAGSATTAQAVLSCNQEDEGGRRFIMVSHPELGVQPSERNLCRDVLRERIRLSAEAMGATVNCAYVRTATLDSDRILFRLDDTEALAAALLFENMPLVHADHPERGVIVSAGGRHVAYERRADAAFRARLASLPKNEPLVLYSWTPARWEGALDRDAGVVNLPAVLIDRLRGLEP